MSDEELVDLLARQDRAFRRRDDAELSYYVALERYRLARQKLEERFGSSLGLAENDRLGARAESAAGDHALLGRLGHALILARGRWESEQEGVRAARQAVRVHRNTQDGS